MAITVHCKLVRDNIPGIIRDASREPQVIEIDPIDRLPLLLAKLREETDELSLAFDVEEVADVLEVLEAIVDLCPFDMGEVMSAKIKKKLEKGGFDQGFFLIKSWPVEGSR